MTTNKRTGYEPTGLRASKSHRRRPTACGFTVLEVLLAILILALVVTTVLASFNMVFSSTEDLALSAEVHDMAQNGLNRMIVDLESSYIVQRPLYKPPDFDDAPDAFRVVGATTDIDGTAFAQLRFTSRAHVKLENSRADGIAEIVYYMHAKPDGQRVLRRSDNLYPYPPFAEKGSDPVLCEHVKSLAFTYFDAEGSEYEDWDSDSDEFGYATPAAIAIRLELGDATTSHIFETMVKFPTYRKKIE
ncbi:MAG: hypothetical protein JSW39_22100 [Desulfobacterales bacterium]|nr:MAG: hypothetical protein JSW39_22100 [Desulfobacterales bacterium]